MIRVVVLAENRALLEMQSADGTPFGAVEILCQPDHSSRGADTIALVTTVDHDGVHVTSEVRPS